MQLVERHKIKPSHQFWQQTDKLCLLSKNIYNYANYQVRQSFIFDKVYLGYNQLYHLVKGTPDYQELPAKVSQQVLWKQSIKLGKQVNQSFTAIPHSRLIEMLVYKAQLLGTKVEVSEESYTSRASFLSLDPIPNYLKYLKSPQGNFKFSGYRESRGMYKQKGSKTRINSDLNGSYNILRKAIPGIFNRRGIEGVVVRPVRITPSRN